MEGVAIYKHSDYVGIIYQMFFLERSRLLEHLSSSKWEAYPQSRPNPSRLFQFFPSTHAKILH
jgi:hypothetical protein